MNWFVAITLSLASIHAYGNAPATSTTYRCASVENENNDFELSSFVLQIVRTDSGMSLIPGSLIALPAGDIATQLQILGQSSRVILNQEEGLIQVIGKSGTQSVMFMVAADGVPSSTSVRAEIDIASAGNDRPLEDHLRCNLN